MMNRTTAYLSAAFLCFGAFTLGAQSQSSGTTGIVEIQLTNNCDVREVWIVRDGDDRTRIRAKMQDGDPCLWRAELPIGDTYHTNVSRFSLRLAGRARSECMKTQWSVEKRAGLLTYDCCKGGDVRQIAVEVKDAPLAYSRKTLKTQCIETGELPVGGPEGDRTIQDVQLQIETLRLKVFENKVPPCGLIVNKLARVLNSKKGKTVTLSRKDAEGALARQDLRGENCHAPMAMGSNIDAMVEILRFKSLDIKVH